MTVLIDPGLVLYLPLHELDGGSFVSQDARGHLCTVNGAAWTPQGRTFDGVDDEIVSQNIVLASLSLMAWVKPGAESWRRIISNAEFGGYTGAVELLRDSSKRLLFQVQDGTAQRTYTATPTLSDEIWIHVAATLDVSMMPAIYINGISVAYTGTTPSYTPNQSPAFPFKIGRTGGGTQSMRWQGAIGDVYVYNRALKSQEIQYLYLATKWRYQ
jgi:hypothetical protein